MMGRLRARIPTRWAINHFSGAASPTAPMKIAVVGAGSMGSVYAGLLAEGGNEVWAVDVWQQHLDAIAQDGLRVEGCSGDRVIKGINTCSDARNAGICDLVIIATKASGVGPAAESIQSILGRDTMVLTIQNGLGAGERIQKYMPQDNILLGVAGGFGASMKGPGHVFHNGMSEIRIGEMSGGLTDRVERVANIWRGSGFNVNAFDDVNQLIWEKFIANVAFSGPCTVYNRTVKEMHDDPHAWSIVLGCAREAYEAAIAKKINLSFSDPEKYVTEFGLKMPNAKPSTLQDHLARRPSEIDAINGMVPVVAAEVGTQAPFNQVVTAIVKSKELEF